MLALVHSSHAVDLDDAVGDLREQRGGVERRKVFSGMSSVFQMTAVALATFLKRLAAAVRRRTAAPGAHLVQV